MKIRKDTFPYGTWKCQYCRKILPSKGKLQKHIHENHVKFSKDGKIIPWNKGLTKESDSRIAKSVENYLQGVKDGRIHVWCEGKHLPDEMKNKISESMKLAHEEGRVHNIGESRWNNEPSYPEKWFMQVIENEFNDKNYIREYPFHKFSLDFAWVNLKKCIEIDGDQHQRFEDYKKRDERKDLQLSNDNWKVLRLAWKDVFKNPKKWIQIAKDFIDN